MSEEEIYKMLLNENIEKFPLLNEIFAIRNNKFKINDYTIYVTGCISLDVINRVIEKANYIDKLQKENELLKAPFEYANGNTLDKRYVELNFVSKDKIGAYCKKELAFKNRLEREKQEISEYNKGRFDTYQNIIEELLGDE